jgi:hypothetical protein
MRGLPQVRGTLTPDRPLADLTWLRVGGLRIGCSSRRMRRTWRGFWVRLIP